MNSRHDMVHRFQGYDLCRKRDDDPRIQGSEWKLKRLTEKQERAFIELGLIRMPVAEKTRRGRPPGSKNKPKVQ